MVTAYGLGIGKQYKNYLNLMVFNFVFEFQFSL